MSQELAQVRHGFQHGLDRRTRSQWLQGAGCPFCFWLWTFDWRSRHRVQLPPSVVSLPPMTRPHLTFFVELTSAPLAELFATAGVVDFLAEGRCTLAMGMLDLTPARAAVVRQLEGRGVPVTAWL